MATWILPRPDRGRLRLPGGIARWAAGIAVLALGVGALSHTSLFHARTIEVSGVSTLSRAQVVQIASLDRHTNVVWLDEGEAEAALQANPWVADAQVSVSLPHTIEVSISERVPVAIASDGQRSVLVATDGTTLGPPAGRASARGLSVIQLPIPNRVEGVVQGPAGAARALGAMGPRLRSSVDRVVVLPDATLEVWLRSGLRVIYGGPDAFAAKARTIARTLAWADAGNREVATLSVVAPWGPAVTVRRPG